MEMDLDLFYRANFVPGVKNRFGSPDDCTGWSEVTLADGATTWVYRDGTPANIKRLANGKYVAVTP